MLRFCIIDAITGEPLDISFSTPIECSPPADPLGYNPTILMDRELLRHHIPNHLANLASDDILTLQARETMQKPCVLLIAHKEHASELTERQKASQPNRKKYRQNEPTDTILIDGVIIDPANCIPVSFVHIYLSHARHHIQFGDLHLLLRIEEVPKPE